MAHNLFGTNQSFDLGNGDTGRFYSLPQLEKEGVGPISRLPISIRIVLESVLRNCDGRKVREDDVRALANWKAEAERTAEIPFVVARIVLQDFTGVPLLVDLAAMRSTVAAIGKNPKIIEPLVPVDLVVDHSVQVDVAGTPDALRRNMEIEFERNRARYQFMKWGMQAFDTFKVVPPGIGIVHQVNLEYLAKGILHKDGVYYPDTLVGTDSHTTMINGLGVVAWGVGGIEAEAGMLGQPVYFLTPDVVGVNLTGSLNEGVTATDLVLHLTEMLRRAKVVGKFVEYFGEGASSLSLTDRATISNMAPEYGATMGFFGVDEETCRYLLATGRTRGQVDAFRNYFTAQGMFGIPTVGSIDYSQVLELDLGDIVSNVAGPKRPQDRIELSNLRGRFNDLFVRPVSDSGYGKNVADLATRFSTSVPANRSSLVQLNPETEVPLVEVGIGHGDVLIAAITSCTNTSNPSVMLAAGLLARRAIEKGLQVSPTVKTSLGPGSRVVSDYLEKTGLQVYLDQLGFNTVGYGCTTCIGNSGPIDPRIEEVVTKNDLIAASVLSGNRNFEARVHQNIKANFLMSPPLVVAFALAGRINIDLTKDPIGKGTDGEDVYLRDIWPSLADVREVLHSALDPLTYQRLYSDFTSENPLWNEIPSTPGDVYAWDADSTYIQQPPFFLNFSMEAGSISSLLGMRPLAILGDSVTTDHISPAGSIKATSPAGKYLLSKGVDVSDFNSYGSRRGNDQVMTRGTFANVRIRNLMVPGIEGGYTKHHTEGAAGEEMSIYDASIKYQSESIPLIVIAGQEYGTGSSRDWAAKGTRLLGVKAVVAQSFERIHRSNLVGMGVLPLQFKEGVSAATVGLTGSELFDLLGLDGEITPRMDVTLVVNRPDGSSQQLAVTLRIDTPIEIEYYQHGGILPYVLRQLVSNN
ncbi:MAG: aconitate hydratase AcnA [Acidobacteria bacterium]|nr:aconitate hydratase AcnA [Acidobacteriota bacterium]